MRTQRTPLALLVALLIGATGCVSGFKQFYVDQLGPNRSRAEVHAGEPEVYSGRDPDQDFVAMVESGYILTGYSSFNGPSASLAQARAQARAVRAAIVLLYSKYTNTVSGVTPLVLNNPDKTVTTQSHGTVYGSGGSASYTGTSTTTVPGGYSVYNIPYSIARYDQMATFWVRGKPPVLGVYVRDLTPEERAQLQRNRGVVVIAVIKKSPAFRADVLHNDVLLRIGSDDLEDVSGFMAIVPRYASKEVDLILLRSGETRTVRVRLNTAT